MRQKYASKLTKEDLIKFGITDVSEDGLTILNKKGKPLKQYLKNKNKPEGYKQIVLYDPLKRQAVPKEKRKTSTGQFSLDVHRIVYIWFHGEQPESMVVDHIDNNKQNNNKDNLQLLSPYQNIWKERAHFNYQLKCDLTKPRSYYEEKLAYYIAMNEEAKERHDSEACHKCRSNIGSVRARLRYWDAHAEEAEENLRIIEAENMEKTLLKEAKADKIAFTANLVELGKIAKEKNDYALWHSCCDLKNEINKTPITEISYIRAIYKNFLLDNKEAFNLKI